MLANATLAATRQSPDRLDIYASVHKDLRALMCFTLLRVGNLDAQDHEDLRSTLGQLFVLLDLLREHLEQENRSVHPLIESRMDVGSRRVAQQHEAHLASIDALAQEANRVSAADAGQ